MGTHLYYRESFCEHEECPQIYILEKETAYQREGKMKLQDIKKIGVAGGGTMGSGIAQIFAQNGYEVVVTDIAEKFLENTKRIIVHKPTNHRIFLFFSNLYSVTVSSMVCFSFVRLRFICVSK